MVDCVAELIAESCDAMSKTRGRWQSHGRAEELHTEQTSACRLCLFGVACSRLVGEAGCYPDSSMAELALPARDSLVEVGLGSADRMTSEA